MDGNFICKYPGKKVNMGFLKKYFNNTCKPDGFLGRMMITGMNSGHAKMAAWGTSKFTSMNPDSIIDLGCGGGKNVQELMKKYPNAKMTAVDYSEVSVECSKKRNKEEIKKGRCKVVQGDVSKLNLKDNTYDLATAFETVYFWPGPVKSFKEVFRILKPDGIFVIVNESDGTNDKDQKWVDIIDGMSMYTEQQMISFLKEAGFKDIKVFHNHKKYWISFQARK